MKHWRPRIELLTLVVVCMACAAVGATAPKPKYVFLFIGDGMGVGQRACGEQYWSAVNDGKPVKLLMNRLPVSGSMTTHSSSSDVTDSAAAGTALASGRKTANGRIGLEPESTDPLETLGDVALASGMKVGIVTSVSIDHATPASFYAHVPKRNQYNDIASQMVESPFTLFAGAVHDRKKEPEFIASMKGRGFEVLTNRKELDSAVPGGRYWMFNRDIDGKSGLQYRIDQPEGYMGLVDFTRRSIELLDNPKGFFLMVEAGKIDWACHGNDLGTCVREVVDLDECVGVALEFYKKHAEETLIVVTADHETGGLGLDKPEPDYEIDAEAVMGQKVSMQAFGAKTRAFKESKKSFEEAWPEISGLFGLEELPLDARKPIETAYNALVGNGKSPQGGLAGACGAAVSKAAGIGWKTGGHTGTPVPTTAVGIGSERFAGEYDNVDLQKRLRELVTR